MGMPVCRARLCAREHLPPVLGWERAWPTGCVRYPGWVMGMVAGEVAAVVEGEAAGSTGGSVTSNIRVFAS